MKQYLCYYCDDESDAFQCIIKHLISFHTKECLEYCKLQLNEATGSALYRTKAHWNYVSAVGNAVAYPYNKIGIVRKYRSKNKVI